MSDPPICHILDFNSILRSEWRHDLPPPFRFFLCDKSLQQKEFYFKSI